MATFPYDAKAQTTAPDGPVQSAMLNAVQDAIIDVAGSYSEMLQEAFADEGVSGGQASWYRDSTNPEYGWICDNTGSLYIPIKGRTTARLTSVELKINDAASGASWTITLHKVNYEFDAASTAPTKAAVTVDTHGAAYSADPGGVWAVITMAPSSDEDLTAEHGWIVEVSAAVGDSVAAARANFERLQAATTEITV